MVRFNPHDEEGVAVADPAAQGQLLPRSDGDVARSPITAGIFAPIDIAPVVFFRITFGLLMFLEIWGYILTGEVRQKWIEPSFHFKYFGFGWAPNPPGNWMYVFLVGPMLGAIGIMLGAYYRVSAAIYCLGATWYFLMEQTNYLNHHYLICLVSFLAIFLPANRRYAVDLWRDSTKRSDVAPAWTLWLLRAQMGIPYFYAGLAKLNSDWLQGEPVRTWFRGRSEQWIGPLLNHEFTVRLVTCGGLTFDLLIVPLLLWRKTRLAAFVAALFFHLSNAVIFRIGVFPFLSIALTILFFPPERHRQILEFVRTKWSGWKAQTRPRVINLRQFGFEHRRAIIVFLSVYLSLQLLVPFRHFLYPGNVSWTEEGHRFAWHMMLRRKVGNTEFVAVQRDSGYAWRLNAREHLTQRQYRKMAGRPDLILQVAHHLQRELNRLGYTNVAIHAVARVQLNHHPAALLIDPETDLTQIRASLRPAEWILPFGNSKATPRLLLTRNQRPPPPVRAAARAE